MVTAAFGSRPRESALAKAVGRMWRREELQEPTSTLALVSARDDTGPITNGCGNSAESKQSVTCTYGRGVAAVDQANIGLLCMNGREHRPRIVQLQHALE